jgi:hypothetical protein
MLQMNLITRKELYWELYEEFLDELVDKFSSELYWEVYWKLFDEVGKELFWSLKIPILTDFRGYNTD